MAKLIKIIQYTSSTFRNSCEFWSTFLRNPVHSSGILSIPLESCPFLWNPVIPGGISGGMKSIAIPGQFRMKSFCLEVPDNELNLSKLIFANAAQQLDSYLDKVYFPALLSRQPLAVDIRMLEFVSWLFVNITPNTTAWCKTLEGFLESQGYRLSTKDTLRKRFGKALRWFNTLQDHTAKHINTMLYHTQRLSTGYDDGCHTEEPHSHCPELDLAIIFASIVLFALEAVSHVLLNILEDSTRNMEQFVDKIRPSRSAKQPKASKRQCQDATNPENHTDEVEDGYDGPLQVPRSVLAICQDSFTAADEHRQKASTQFFSQTALMALLCCHDHVLWIVSMSSAGEKQHYILALLETFFQHVPLTLTVIYHPRKCIGFGLSDGEGCESITNVFTPLTVKFSILRGRVYSDSASGSYDASAIVERKGSMLRKRWKNATRILTCFIESRSKNNARYVVERTLQLRKARDILKNQIRELEDVISDELSKGYAIVEAELALPEFCIHFQNLVAQVQAAEHALGVGDRSKLKQLVNNPFVSTRMNACALKIRLQEKLRCRKFELDQLERSFHHQVNQHKVDQHTESSIQWHDPGIQKLAHDYNKLCKMMKTLKVQGKAPQGAVCPEEIELAGLFALDVDDDIWQDIGLDDTLDDPHASAAPPLWLCDENVCSGIKAVLELDRCIEEEDRLAWERSSLQIWYAEEWEVLCAAYNVTGKKFDFS
ncbi:hypothetical protein BDZ97DRAFT_1754964 [Flammula alnicola]|nr:hypothetical protein BDZ97DRAFT_1754964 [Flammula alnicola]